MTSANIEREFRTPIGIVRCGIKAESIDYETIQLKSYQNGSSQVFKTDSHQIELIEFKRRLPLHTGETVSDTLGWIWRIEKVTNKPEHLELYCLLEEQSDQVIFDIATGEHLEAIEAFDERWTLHIGTEDGEIINSRARNNDWFPIRL